MAAKQFTLETRDCYNYGIWVVDIIKDNGIELPQSTACDLLNKLTEENEELNSIKKFADRNGICIFNIDEAFRRCWQDNAKLVKENEELKKQLASINRLIDNKIDEFKKGDYGDLPCNTIHMFLDLKQELGDLND